MAPKRQVSDGIFNMLHATGVLKMLLYAYPARLTVLSYHRVDDPSRPGFDTYKPTVDATPAGFRQQMQYVQRHYNSISCGQLAAWLRGEWDLPPRAAIITFDDGYSDNLIHAYPILQQLGLPATIFLCTDHVGSDVPFHWDHAAYCFAHTRRSSADLPLLGQLAWADQSERDRIAGEWVQQAKRLGDGERLGALAVLAQSLDVDVSEAAFAGLYLNWDQVREMSRGGIEFGSHTASHAILSRIPLDRAQREVTESRQRIQAETGKPVISLAYPNGGLGDFSPEVAALLPAAGIELAFTLLQGPTRYRTVRAAPLAIRRISFGRSHSLARFAARLAGVARWR